MELRYNAKIIIGKEEGDMSHICQPYNQYVAKLYTTEKLEEWSSL